MRALAPGFRSRSKLWSRAVAVCWKISAFIHSTESPTLIPGGTGPNAMFAMRMTWTVEPAAARRAAKGGTIRKAARTKRRLQLTVRYEPSSGGEMLGVHLMLLEELETGAEQRLQLGILRVGNQRAAQGIVDGLVVGDLVLDICPIERRPIKLAQVAQLGLGLARQGRARRIGLRRHAQLLHQRQRLIVDRRVVTDHFLGEGADLGVLALLQRLLAGLDVDHPGGVGDVGDLRIRRRRGRLRVRYTREQSYRHDGDETFPFHRQLLPAAPDFVARGEPGNAQLRAFPLDDLAPSRFPRRAMQSIGSPR